MGEPRGGDLSDMADSAQPRTDVLVIGGGISGIACARALTAAGVPVRVLERSGRVGGRLASPPLPRGTDDGRPVDLGAAYFTVSDDAFAEQVADWERRGLARPWTDTLQAYAADGTAEAKSGPQRWAAPGGLRSLVADLAEGLTIETRREVSAVTPGPAVDGEPACAVVLAMPDPQAARLVAAPLRAAQAVADREWEPVIAVALGYDERTWPELPAAFVNDHPVLSLVADDGSRRGDDAPVLVAHTTGDLARRHLDDPDGVIDDVVGAVGELLGLDAAPRWTHAHRWTFASPAAPHDTPADAPFHLDDDLIAVVGDGWGSPKVETAWRSGTLLGRALAARVTC
ncbi:hypothetical protein Acsp07_21380 [Actinomycetospora sp. NBRC 106378]|nr:hypothetical protein Acsp07_21380 [Actinomycetospora sp. NBRC 106378]